MGLKLLEQIEERKTGQTTKIVDVLLPVDGKASEKAKPENPQSRS